MRRLFIANRGEIARRIMRAAGSMGIESVVPYVPNENKSLHRSEADIGVLIPPGGYLDAELIVDLAKTKQCDALHPGYGFLSEQADFAELVEKAGIIFVGPSPETMRELGEKSRCRKRARDLGIPVSEGYEGDDQSDERLNEEARRIGFPLLIKAAAGGGGRGMRLVNNSSEFQALLESARQEGKLGFGDSKLLLERYFPEARHVEIQIIGDGSGEVRHLFGRDCSIQRRYQKLVEEAPALFLEEKLQEKLFESAISLGASAKLRGVSTVEFLVSPKRSEFIFLEVNCRLQVEHPVTEAILELDLVQLQLKIAAATPLNMLLNEQKMPKNHAIEARVVSEDPYQNFLPSLGTIRSLNLPHDVRVEHALQTGDKITGEFDSLLAKVIAVGDSRERAIKNLTEALKQFKLIGVATNIPFLNEVLSDKKFLKGEISGAVADRALKSLGESRDLLPDVRKAVSTYIRSRFSGEDSFRMVPLLSHADETYRVECRGERFEVVVAIKPAKNASIPLITVNGIEEDFSEGVVISESEVLVGEELFFIERLFPGPGNSSDKEHGSLEITASLPGRVVAIKVKEGQKLASDEVVMTIESMKMEHQIKARRSGIVGKVLVTVGQTVAANQPVLLISESQNVL